MMMLVRKLNSLVASPEDHNIRRVNGLRRFAFTITVFNIIGHAFLGFEQPIIMPIFALITGYSLEILLELIDAWINQRSPRFLGKGRGEFINYFLPAHIGSLAIAMLIYPNENLGPIFFAVSVCICSKSIFRVTIGTRTQHFFNPSNLGIAVTLILFPHVGLAAPYHFTENLSGFGDWVIVFLIFVSGILLNTVLTRRMPLICAWISAFFLQAVVRSIFFDIRLVAALVPVTGLAFVLFTFYMITDPATTPSNWTTQIIFGASVAVVYGVLVQLNIVFGLFFALVLVSAARGLGIAATEIAREVKRRQVLVPTDAELPEVTI